jgi:hypothetical protein
MMFFVKEVYTARSTLLITLFCFILVVPARSDVLTQQIRETVNMWRDAVVTVKVVVELRNTERKMERLATVVDSSGILMMSLTSIDPTGLGFMPENIEIKVKEVNIVTPGNEEIPAKIVLRDRDLDLAVIQPFGMRGKPMTAVAINTHVTPEVMDQIVIISRLGSAANYTTMSSLCRISGIITKPRTLYVPDINISVNGLGTPVFTTDGELVGLMLLRTAGQQETSPADLMWGFGSFDIVPVIVPAEELARVLKEMP